MNRKQRIQTILSKELPEWSIELVDDSINHKGHFGLSGNSESHLIINLRDLLYLFKSKNRNLKLEFLDKILILSFFNLDE